MRFQEFNFKNDKFEAEHMVVMKPCKPEHIAQLIRKFDWYLSLEAHVDFDHN